MDRRVNVYTQVPPNERLVLWDGINQGRTALQTLRDYAGGRKAIGRNGTVLNRIEDAIAEHSSPFLLTPSKGEYPKPTSLNQAVAQLDEAKGNFNEVARLNYPLVRHIAGKHLSATEAGLGITVADLEGYGQVGLVQAADRYDHRQGVDFGQFAPRRISGAINDALRSLSPHSRDDVVTMRGIAKVTQEVWIQFGRPPTLVELKERTGLDDETLKTMSILSNTYLVSLNMGETDQFDSTGRPPMELSLRSEYGLEDKPEALPDVLALRQALGSGILSERELLAINGYFFDDLNMPKIAKEMGISTSRVSQYLDSAKSKIAAYLERKPPTWIYVPELDKSPKPDEIPLSNSKIELRKTSEPVVEVAIQKTPDLSKYEPADADDISPDEYKLAVILFPTDPNTYNDIWKRNHVAKALGRSNSWVENHRTALSWKLWYENDAQRDPAEIPPLKSVLLQRLGSIPLYAKTTMPERDKIMWMEMDIDTLENIAKER